MPPAGTTNAPYYTTNGHSLMTNIERKKIYKLYQGGSSTMTEFDRFIVLCIFLYSNLEDWDIIP